MSEALQQGAVLGVYTIGARIGIGGMAEVYEAWPENRDKPVAIKVLLPNLRSDRTLCEMFRDEARIAAELDHPNIVRVLDVVCADGVDMMVMERLAGWDVAQLLSRQGAIGAGGAAFIIRAICSALDYVHQGQREIVHRDVSPQNIFITTDGRIKLTDFGVAKAKARVAQTTHRQIKGKLAYLAPEQATGESVSGRTDLYAAGLVLYELIGGTRLLDADSDVDLLRMAQNPPAASYQGWSSESLTLRPVIDRALKTSPVMRYRRAADMARALDGALAGLGYDEAAWRERVAAFGQVAERPAARPRPAPAAGPNEGAGRTRLASAPNRQGDERPKAARWGTMIALALVLMSGAALLLRRDWRSASPPPAGKTDQVPAASHARADQGESLDQGVDRGATKPAALKVGSKPRTRASVEPRHKVQAQRRAPRKVQVRRKTGARRKTAARGKVQMPRKHAAQTKTVAQTQVPPPAKAKASPPAVTRRGVESKLARLAQRLKRANIDDSKRRRLNRLSQRAAKALLAGNLTAADGFVSQALRILGR